MASGISRVFVRALGIVDCLLQLLSSPAGICFDGGPYSAAGDAPLYIYAGCTLAGFYVLQMKQVMILLDEYRCIIVTVQQ